MQSYSLNVSSSRNCAVRAIMYICPPLSWTAWGLLNLNVYITPPCIKCPAQLIYLQLQTCFVHVCACVWDVCPIVHVAECASVVFRLNTTSAYVVCGGVVGYREIRETQREMSECFKDLICNHSMGLPVHTLPFVRLKAFNITYIHTDWQGMHLLCKLQYLISTFLWPHWPSDTIPPVDCWFS